MGPSPLRRISLLWHARLAAQQEGSAVPVAALVMQAFVTAVLCGLVRDLVSPYVYALIALSVSGALVALPLLGELSPLLYRDEADEWIRAQPIAPREVDAARAMHLLTVVCVLALGSLVPAALIAYQFSLPARLLLIAAGVVQAAFIAGALKLTLLVLGKRAEPLLVACQTLLLAGIIVGGAFGLRRVSAVAELDSPVPELAPLPPAWFAAAFARDGLFGAPWPWLSAACAASLAALAVLFLLRAPRPDRARGGETLLGRLLWPLRRLASRAWVAREERGVFEWVFEALPKERDFVLRTYPLLGIPLAFLAVGSSGGSLDEREGLLALLLFTPGMYLPILIAYTPACASHAARWLVDGAPVTLRTVRNATLKAISLRFLVPLFALLGVLCWAQVGPWFALRLALPGFLVAHLMLRFLYVDGDTAAPLSVAPDEIHVQRKWFEVMMGLAFVLAILAAVAHRSIATVSIGLGVSLLLVITEIYSDFMARRPRT